MILIDMNQVTISNLMMQIGSRGDNEVDEDLVRHMVLNSLRSYRSKFSEEYGELILCYDSKHYWRREIFPNYKCNRKKDRKKSGLDWNNIFETLNKIRDEIKEYFPYKVIEVYGAEADDIIASLVFHVAKRPSNYEKILIISSDKDFFQLQTHTNVKQFSPTLKKFVNGSDPKEYIKEHILKGDRSDGIPNFLSPDNTFIDSLRQKPLGSGKIAKWKDLELDEFCNEEMMRNYQRNQKLIDLSFVPQDLQEKILDEYENVKVGERSGLLNYFIKKRLKNLINDIGDF